MTAILFFKKVDCKYIRKRKTTSLLCESNATSFRLLRLLLVIMRNYNYVCKMAKVAKKNVIAIIFNSI